MATQIIDEKDSDLNRLKTHKNSKFFPDAQSTIDKYSNKSSGSSVYKASGGTGGSVPNAYGDMESELKDQKDDAESALKKRKKAYGKLYDQLRSNLEASRGDATTQRDNALTGLDSDYNSALTRANSAKSEATEFYDDQEASLRTSYEDQKKDQARIFQGRNITNSSYYIDAVTKADEAFNKTLSSLGKDEARKILEYDTQISDLATERMTKRTEIETAYQATIRQIEADITKTDVEKADAFERLNSEYESKMGTINQSLLTIQQQQKAYREKIASTAFDTGYKNEKYNIDLNTDALKMKTASGNQALLEALMATKGTDGYVDPDEYMRLRTASTASPGTFDGKYSGYLNPNDVAKVMGKSIKSGLSGLSFEDL